MRPVASVKTLKGSFVYIVLYNENATSIKGHSAVYFSESDGKHCTDTKIEKGLSRESVILLKSTPVKILFICFFFILRVLKEKCWPDIVAKVLHVWICTFLLNIKYAPALLPKQPHHFVFRKINLQTIHIFTMK